MCADENVLISEDTAEDVLVGEEQEWKSLMPTQPNKAMKPE
jgi:hypothetical protein